jgi:hypothetical protein
MIYAIAVAIGFVSAVVALLLPLWLRAGRGELATGVRRLAPVLVAILILLLAVTWAISQRLGPIVDLSLALLSAGVAAWWLMNGPSRKEAALTRSLMILALVISILLIVFSFIGSNP